MGRVEREVYAAATSPRHVRALTVGAGTLLAALPLPAPLRAGLGIAGYLGGLALPADHVPTDEPDHLWHLRRQVGAVGDWLDDRRGALGWDVETWLDRVLARARGVLDDPRLVTDPERLAGLSRLLLVELPEVLRDGDDVALEPDPTRRRLRVALRLDQLDRRLAALRTPS